MQMLDFLKQEIDSSHIKSFMWDCLKGKTVLITGATGLIGSLTCKLISCVADLWGLNIKLIAMVRNRQKAEEIFADVLDYDNIFLLEQDVTTAVGIEEHVDYIIHTACPTASNTFVTKPVETIRAIVQGTENILEIARRSCSTSVVYLSSMEAYGQILHENPLQPEDVGYVNPLSLRSCYPEGKRLAENLCVSYYSEYQVPVKVVRLAQTFGPGIPKDDNRVFAQFTRSVLTGENIVMYTEGGSKRMYLDTVDAVMACLTVLLKGENGQVYNAANPETYCSIKDMAELVIKEFGKCKCRLVIDKSKNVGQYPPDNMLCLDVEPLKQLGWTANYDLKTMYQRMINLM